MMRVEIWVEGKYWYTTPQGSVEAEGGASVYATKYNKAQKGSKGIHAIVVSRPF